MNREPHTRPFDALLHMPEAGIVRPLLAEADLSPAERERVAQKATHWINHIRTAEPPAMEALLQDIGLMTPAGLALMGLAEALLRIPDDATVNALIEDKLGDGLADYEIEASRLLAKLADVGLGLSQRILTADNVLEKLLKHASLPVMRAILRRIIRRMGNNFIIGEDVARAFTMAASWAARGYLMHYDMLGEGARTMADADRYYERYHQLIVALKNQATKPLLFDNPGVSIKLSALHPRFEETQRQRVMQELYPRARALCMAAMESNIALVIDAEEADRYELTLDIIEALALDPALKHWAGLGFALQAYGVRARPTVDWFIDLARRRGTKVTLRLVKGAYWDTEIKRGQERGLDAYPVFTRKANTDVSYIACAKAMLAARDVIYPQFASHNALTQATITTLAEPDGSYEIQRLQGMGSVLFDAIKATHPQLKTRIYAPVGEYEDLLTYLVRRLLENGANSNFVHQLADKKTPVASLLRQPVDKVKLADSIAHPCVPLPVAMLGKRQNSKGWDTAERGVQHMIAAALAKPPRFDLPKTVVDEALFARVAGSDWHSETPHHRAAVMRQAASLMEAEWGALTSLIVSEGKRTVNDALSEIREAVDFCRYYADEAEALQGRPKRLPGPAGETNELHYYPRGTFVCISPWNFPLAIFAGQTVAALVVGNSVITKPAEQTPRTGAYVVDVLHRAGVPKNALQLVLGDGDVGAKLVAHASVAGVCFTGSIGAAKSISRTLAAKDGPIVPLIAETGGINGLIVDSSALLEQVCDDVLTSGFRSAGQRCSALRVLFVQDDVADKLVTMLRGAMAELKVGDPADLATDVGPIIDEEAHARLQQHLKRMYREANILAEAAAPSAGNFIAPTLIELKSIDQMPDEVFGPIVHIIRYKAKDLYAVIEQINATGYGLTFGLHTRMVSRARAVFAKAAAGNVYVNRSIIGAVVGVQPFGGSGLSGTGPKAGGPDYLHRFVHERTLTINTTASGGNVALLAGIGDDA